MKEIEREEREIYKERGREGKKERKGKRKRDRERIFDLEF